jgi:hypothetical protein
MQTSELTNSIKSRRSMRNWQDKPVPEKFVFRTIICVEPSMLEVYL